MKPDLDELDRLLAEATPGPLTACLGSGNNLCTALMNEETATLVCDFLPDYFLDGSCKVPHDHRADMNLFLALRNAAPRLLALARAGERMVDAYERCFPAMGEELERARDDLVAALAAWKEA